MEYSNVCELNLASCNLRKPISVRHKGECGKNGFKTVSWRRFWTFYCKICLSIFLPPSHLSTLFKEFILTINKLNTISEYISNCNNTKRKAWFPWNIRNKWHLLQVNSQIYNSLFKKIAVKMMKERGHKIWSEELQCVIQKWNCYQTSKNSIWHLFNNKCLITECW